LTRFESRVHTTPKEFENRGFTPKMFFVHTKPEEFVGSVDGALESNKSLLRALLISTANDIQ